MASSDSSDPYINPETGILRNKVGARSQRELEQAEADLFGARAYQLLFSSPPPPTGDIEELRSIHRHLFQDVYDWAGEIRTVDISKNLGESQRSESFMPVPVIKQGMMNAAEQLREDNYLTGMARDQFIERLSHHYDQVNYVHPFREGNGRTQRMFWDRITRDAGYELDWQQITGATNDKACRVAAEQRDLSELHAMFDRIVQPAGERGGRTSEYERVAELRRLSVPRGVRDSLSQGLSGPVTRAASHQGKIRRSPRDPGMER